MMSNQMSQAGLFNVTTEELKSFPSHLSCDVAIVGYGPVGMILAALLAQRGLSVVVVERFPARYPLGRAGHFDGESFRTFQRLGIAEDMELLARPMIQWQLVTGQMEVLATIKLGEGGAGWKESYLTYQPEFEVVFDRRVRELGARVLMGANVTSLEQDEQGTRLTVECTDGAESRVCTIEAAFTFGADGAKSFVRNSLGISRHDLGFKANDQLVIDFEYHDPDYELDGLPEVFQVLDIQRPELAGRWSGGRFSRFEFNAREGESREYLEREDTAWTLLSKWGIRPELGRIDRHSVYSFESTLAERWRVGRVLITGDAAHTMPPFMGQGLGSGIRDALNVSWKIAAVLAGKAELGLLDSYEAERKPHVEAIIHMSSGVGNLVLMTDPEKAARRDEMFRSGQVPPAPTFPPLGPGLVRQAGSPFAHALDGRPSIQGRVAQGKRVERLDQFLGLGWKLIARHPLPSSLFNDQQRNLIAELNLDTAHVSRGANAEYVDIDGDYDLWYRNTGQRVFLVRPDHYIFGSARTLDELPQLLDDLASSLAAAGWRGAADLVDEPLAEMQMLRPN